MFEISYFQAVKYEESLKANLMLDILRKKSNDDEWQVWFSIKRLCSLLIWSGSLSASSLQGLLWRSMNVKGSFFDWINLDICCTIDEVAGSSQNLNQWSPFFFVKTQFSAYQRFRNLSNILQYCSLGREVFNHLSQSKNDHWHQKFSWIDSMKT